MSRGFLLNLALIQVGWFIAVLSAAGGRAWPGPVFAVAVVVLYLSASRHRGRELALVIASTLLGFAVDSTLVQLELVRFAASWLSGSIAPAWTLGLWALLATAFYRSMGWLCGKPAAAVALAPIAPLTYWAGARLGAAEFPEGLGSGLVGIGVGWAIALPLLAVLAARLHPPLTALSEAGRPAPDSRDGHEEGIV